MALHQINVDLDSKHVLSYATEANLMKRINEDKEMYPDYDDRFIVIRTPRGRWTALVMIDRNVGGYIGRYGFVKI